MSPPGTMHDANDNRLEHDHPVAYRVAKHLIEHGVPVFLARPDPGSSTGYSLPPRWQQSRPDLTVLERWQPGWALCRLDGVVIDDIDVDPRHGGDESVAAMQNAGLWPNTYGTVKTPSGGTHHVIARLHGSTRHGSIAAGIDIQSGADDGSGRGFVFMPPTVRISKTTGEPAQYIWITEADISDMDGDTSGNELADVMGRNRYTPPDPDDPFEVQQFTIDRDTAMALCRSTITAYQNLGAHDTHYNDKLNQAAVVLGNCLDLGLFTYAQAMQRLLKASKINGAIDYQGLRAVRNTIHSGLLAGKRNPYKLKDAPPDAAQVDSFRAKFLSPSALRNMPSPRPLIRHLINLNTISWLIGKSSTYKSFLALDMACHVASGKKWQNRPVEQGTVMYIIGEGLTGTVLRFKAWEKRYGKLEDESTLLFYPMAIQVKDAQTWMMLCDFAADVKPNMIVFDTQSRMTVGLQENDNSEMMVFVDGLEQVRRASAGGTPLVLHHLGRQGTDARGASSIDGAQDTELRIEKTADRRATIHLDKQKDAPDTDKIYLALDRIILDELDDQGEVQDSLAIAPYSSAPAAVPPPDWEANLTPNQAHIIGVFRDIFPSIGGTKAEIRARVKERGIVSTGQSFYRAWDALVSSGLIVQTGQGARWIAPPANP